MLILRLEHANFIWKLKMELMLQFLQDYFAEVDRLGNYKDAAWMTLPKELKKIKRSD